MEDNAVSSGHSTIDRSGGVDIAADAVHVAGDVVGRDKITNVYQVSPSLEIKPPPEPVRPPETPGFVGRETELLYFTQQLATRRLAVISGMPGAGKTALAAMLAKRASAPDKLFWHTFHAGEDINVLIWKLAAFLAWHEQTVVWRMLQGAQAAGGQMSPAAVLFDYVFQTLRGQDYLLCFDDFHLLEGDPLLEQFAERLQKATRASELSAIIASRHTPDNMFTAERNVLAGLSAEDARYLIAKRSIDLSDDLSAALYSATQGNAQLMILAIDALRRAKNSAKVIARLTEAEDIERYLLTQVDDQLSENERQVISAVAVLFGYPGTRQAIAAILDGVNIRRTLSNLIQRNLLISTEIETEREYSAHAIVRAFYYDSLDKRERQTMHDRAGLHYEVEELDAFRAALHFEAASKFDHAATVMVSHVANLIDQGKSQMILEVLQRLTNQITDPALGVQVHEVRGDLHYLRGELNEAIHDFEDAQRKTVEDLARVRLLRKTSEVLTRQGEPERALEQLTRAHDLSKPTRLSDSESGPLAVVYSTVMLNLGRYDEAASAAQVALAQLPSATNLTVAASLHDVLGKVYFFKGQLAPSLEQFQIALEFRQSAADQKALLKSYSNLAVVYGHQRHYAEALRANQAALEIAERIGDAIALGMLYNNMAVDAVNQDDYEQAIEVHRRSLALHERMGDLRGLALAYRNLGDVYRHLENFELATEHIKQAIEIAQQVSDADTLTGSIVALAEVYFSQGRLDEALVRCRESLDRAERIHHASLRPVSLQLMGRIYHTMHRWSEARVCFEEANHIWHDREAWIDQLNTLLSWAKMERDAGQLARAQGLCARAMILAEEVHAVDLQAQAATLQSELITLPNQ